MDLERFQRELEAAIADELREHAGVLRERVIRSVAVDAHPWDGHLGLGVLTDEHPEYETLVEQREELASWRLPDVGATRASLWARAATLARAMQDAYESDGELAPAILAACARALEGPRVTEVLRGLTLAPHFERFVGDPDDFEQVNLCAPEAER